MFGMPQIPFIRRRQQRQPGTAGARLRGPARRQHRHGLPVPPRHGVQHQRHRRARISSSSYSSSTPTWHRSWGSRSRSRRATRATVGPRIDLLIARAAAGECDVVVKGTIAGQQRGAVRLASGQFRTDRASEALLSDAPGPRAGGHRGAGADLHLRPAGQRHARRHRPRRGRILRPHGGRRGHRTRPTRAASRAAPRRRPRPRRVRRRPPCPAAAPSPSGPRRSR